MAEKDKELIENIEKQEYKYGFTSDIETETIPRGLNEEVVRLISTKKGRVPFVAILAVVLVFAVVFSDPPRILLLIFLAYAASGPIQFLLKSRRRKA